MVSTEKIEELIRPTVEAMGFDLVLVRLHGGQRPRLVVMAEPQDHGRAMNVEDCAEISHAVSAVLDVEDPIAGTYTLEVSSPGIDRPLVRRADFERFAGERGRIETDEMIEGRRRFTGRLDGTDGDTILMTLDGAEAGQQIRIALGMIRKARLEVPSELKPAMPRPGGQAGTRKGKPHHGA